MPPHSNRMLLVVVVLALGPVEQINSAPSPGEATRATPTETAATRPPAGAWRRTSQGWQRTSSWPVQVRPTNVPPVAKVHPLVLAALIGLLSLGALIGFGSSRRMLR